MFYRLVNKKEIKMRTPEVKNTATNPNGSIDIFFKDEDLSPINLIVQDKQEEKRPSIVLLQTRRLDAKETIKFNGD